MYYQSIDCTFLSLNGKSKLLKLERFIYPIEVLRALCLRKSTTEPSDEKRGNWFVPVVVSGLMLELREEAR